MQHLLGGIRSKTAVGTTGNESVPKIIINDTINLFFSILVILNHNSYRVLFDKIASVCVI